MWAVRCECVPGDDEGEIVSRAKRAGTQSTSLSSYSSYQGGDKPKLFRDLSEDCKAAGFCIVTCRYFRNYVATSSLIAWLQMIVIRETLP